MNKSETPATLIKRLLSLLLQLIKLLFKGMAYIIRRIKQLFRFSITFKITVVYAFIFSLLLLVISGSVLGVSAYFLKQQAERNLRSTLANTLETMDKGDYSHESYLKQIAEKEGIIFVILDNRRREIFSTGENILEEGTGFFRRPILAREIVTLKEEAYTLEAAKYLKTEATYMTVLLMILLVLNMSAIFITLIMGSKASRKMLKPIEKMTKTVKHISIHQLNTRLDVGGSQDELKDLAETFNAMLDRIEASYQQQNQFVSDASHELRTPISVLQGYANLLDRWGKEDKEVLQESIEAIKSESENMKDLIEKLLFLARADKNLQKLELTEFSMGELMSELVKEAKLIDDTHEFVCNIKEDYIFYGDRKSIKQLLRILVDNSVKFTPEGGKISLHQKTWKNFMVIEVEDTGIGIAQEELPHIFERFYRVDKARTKTHGGQGLGLSIAKWIVESHHGKIEVKSLLGVGTKFIIMLPHKN